MFVCPRCHYTTKYKYNLKKHFNRKTPCNNIYSYTPPKDIDIHTCRSMPCANIKSSNSSVIQRHPGRHPASSRASSRASSSVIQSQPNKIIYSCKYCNALFKYRQGKYTHEQNRCIYKDTHNQLIKHTDNDNDTYTQLNNILEQMRENNFNNVEEEKKFLIDQIKKINSKDDNSNNFNNGKINNSVMGNNNTLKDNTINNTNNTIKDNTINNTNNTIKDNTINNNTNNIVINNYGDECLKHITKDQLKKFIVDNPYKSIVNLLTAIHFNKEHPENRNIVIINKRDPYLYLYIDGNWYIRNKNEIITNIISKKSVILDSYFEEIKDIISRQQKEKYEVYKLNRECDPHERKNLVLDIQFEIINDSSQREDLQTISNIFYRNMNEITQMQNQSQNNF